MADQETSTPGFLYNCPPLHALGGLPAHALRRRQALRLSTRPTRLDSLPPFLTSEASKFLLGKPCLKTEDNAERRKPQGGRLEPSQLTSRSLRPGLIPMATPPSAGSNARADARAPAVPHSPPMSIEGTRGRGPPSLLEGQSGTR